MAEKIVKDSQGLAKELVNDCISRQAAIEAIKEDKIDLTNPNVVAVFKATGDFEKVETQVMTCDRHIAILKDLPSAQPEQRWIPCGERLPEEDGQYLITVKYKHVNDSYEDVYAEHGEWYDGRWDMFCFGHCGEVEDIIAWMPLPEPYKEDDK